MFIDRARVFVKAGDGGDGMSSFRRENTFQMAALVVVMVVKVRMLFLKLTRILIRL